MARARPSRKPAAADFVVPVESDHRAWDEVAGLLLLGLGTVLLLALMSYDAADLPGWVLFSLSDEPNRPTRNFIGPVGAVLAGYAFFLLGLASYLAGLVLVWFGIAKFMARSLNGLRAPVGAVLFLFAGASLLHVQGVAFHEWRSTQWSLGPGGGIGWFFAEKLMGQVLGTIGTMLALVAVYVCGLIMLTGFHPLHYLVELKRGLAWSLEQRRERRREAALQAERERERAAYDPLAGAGSTAKATGRGKGGAKRGRGKGKAGEDDLPTLPFPDFPEPKIIDASASRRAPAGGKPSLQDVWQRRKAGPAGGQGGMGAPAGTLEAAFADYNLPPLDLLDWGAEEDATPADRDELLEIQATIVRTLASFGIQVTPGDITRGPAITRFEIYPSDGLRVNRISALEADLARATRAERINILAPIPGKDTVGIEIANKDKILVPLRELLEDKQFQDGRCRLPLALGKDVYGKTIIADLAAMPHLLVAGATGSGKSVCINSVIASLVYQFPPDELRFIMIDPKVVEMQIYNRLPHLALPVVTDPKKVILALRWVVKEMEKRYQIFAKERVRNFESFNKRPREKPRTQAELDLLSAGEESAQGEDADGPTHDEIMGGVDYEPPPKTRPAGEVEMTIPDKMPFIVVIIDELADLMQTAPADVESAVARITQMARAAGIHMIVATQTPRADVITGVIKANIPSRIAFQVASALDSRVILDQKGADKLVGKGDMLYLPPGSSKLMRAQGAFVTDDEITRLVDFCGGQSEPVFDVDPAEAADDDGFGEEEVSEEDEELLERCLEVIRQEKRASTSLLQRRLRLGYTRAARMIDVLEDRGIIGPGEGAKPREILVTLDAEEM